jgi:hypothetical protein
MANGWALGKLSGEFGQGAQTYAGAARAAIYFVASFHCGGRRSRPHQGTSGVTLAPAQPTDATANEPLHTARCRAGQSQMRAMINATDKPQLL